MKTNQRLLSADKIAHFKKIGRQTQDDKLIIECLYNKDTLKEYYLFEYDSKTNKAKCFTNNDFTKVLTIDMNEMRKNRSMRYVLGFKKEKVSEIVESMRNKQLADEHYEHNKTKKVYTDMEKQDIQKEKQEEKSEQEKEFDAIRNNEQYEWER